ncbi:TetR/AcrR family transcriptional regulator [Nocardia sp. NBC_01329]|uniref:TetR/AcrR family transcriptional regulator n=1 Tax=Nocardia sp. NBC_01329 TaxID=2903594 RepID=UPI002E160E53|nr:TetR/AcrR family transcriptional regulator [Nocardia sp. NBC_01329]
MSTRRRLAPEERRLLLIDAGERLFAERAYDDVLMEDVAAAAGVSRALLYRHFPNKRELFAGIYRRATEQLLGNTVLDPERPLMDQIIAALDTHFDYFEANAHSVIAANRQLAGDPTVQAIIWGELGELRHRMLDAIGLTGRRREVASSVIIGWLTFVRVLTVDWLEQRSCTREQLRDICIAALVGALEPITAQDES